MQNSKVTQKTIAKIVGVDKSTVSICLGNPQRAERIRPEIRQRILEEAARLNYKPNFFASQLRRGKSKVILVGLQTLKDPHTGVLTESFERRAADRGYRVIICCFHDAANPLSEVQEILGPQAISAVALITSAKDVFAESDLMTMLDSGTDLVLLSRTHRDGRVAQVSIDEAAAGRLAFDHLHERGVRKFWILADSPALWAIQELRINGMLERSAAVGGPAPHILRASKPSDGLGAMAGYEAIRDELKRTAPPEGVIAVRDVLAYGALRAFNEAGIRVGRDVGIVGHDDLWPSEVMWPSLTTIHQPVRRIGLMAADLIIDKLEDKAGAATKILIQPELVVRESTVALNRSGLEKGGNGSGAVRAG